MEEKTLRQELEELLAKLSITISFQEGEEEVAAILDSEEGEIAKITDSTEEAVCKKVLSILSDAVLCMRAREVFGDALAGVIIIK